MNQLNHHTGVFKYYVATQKEDETSVGKIMNACKKEDSLLVLDCEGVNLSAEGELTLLQVAFYFEGKIQCVVFDVKLICGEHDKVKNFEVLLPLLEREIDKVFHDVHMDAAALKHQFNCEIINVLDTQLVLEYFTGKSL